MFYIYVLRSQKNGKRYVGQTENLERRLLAHNSGESIYTKSGAPWALIYKETYDTRSEAVRRELYLKTGKGREFLDNLGQ